MLDNGASRAVSGPPEVVIGLDELPLLPTVGLAALEAAVAARFGSQYQAKGIER
jgi:hypothetical protein